MPSLVGSEMCIRDSPFSNKLSNLASIPVYCQRVETAEVRYIKRKSSEYHENLSPLLHLLPLRYITNRKTRAARTDHSLTRIRERNSAVFAPVRRLVHTTLRGGRSYALPTGRSSPTTDGYFSCPSTPFRPMHDLGCVEQPPSRELLPLCLLYTSPSPRD